MNILTITLGVMVAGSAFAECPSNLDTDQLIECITVEGSGANYQSWKKKHDKLVDNSAVAYDSDSKAVANTNIRKAVQPN